MKTYKVLNDYLDKFTMLTPSEVQIIKDVTVIKTYKKGTQMLKEGQVLGEGYFILEGCMREFVLKDGKEKTTGIYTEGEAVNHFNDGSPSKYFVVCVEDCTASLSNQKLIVELEKRIPRINEVIHMAVKESMTDTKEKMSTFMASSPEERYLDLLENRPHVFNRLPQHQIASYLGIEPESLSRLRKRIHSQGK